MNFREIINNFISGFKDNSQETLTDFNREKILKEAKIPELLEDVEGVVAKSIGESIKGRGKPARVSLSGKTPKKINANSINRETGRERD